MDPSHPLLTLYSHGFVCEKSGFDVDFVTVPITGSTPPLADGGMLAMPKKANVPDARMGLGGGLGAGGAGLGLGEGGAGSAHTHKLCPSVGTVVGTLPVLR